MHATKFTGDLVGNVTGNCSGTAGGVAWNNVSGKPSTYTPSSHTHNDIYYTETEVNNLLSGKANTSGTYSSLTVGNATKATQDASGNVITTTYATKTDLSGKANDAGVVHLANEETITGIKHFTTDIYNKNTNTLVAETPTVNQYIRYRFTDNKNDMLASIQYANRANGTRDLALYLTAADRSTLGVVLDSAKSFRPLANNSYSLGSSFYKWASVYATNFYGDFGSFSNKVEAPRVRATADLGLVLANKDSNAPTTTSGWNQVQFYDKNLVQLGYFQLSSNTNANVYNWVGRKNADLTNWRNIFWNVDADVFGCDPDNTVSLGSSSYRWSQLHCTEITTYTQNFQRNIYGNYGTFWRQDGNDLYLLLTASGNQNGNWTSARPIRVNLSTGKCYINGVDPSATNGVGASVTYYYIDSTANPITNSDSWNNYGTTSSVTAPARAISFSYTPTVGAIYSGSYLTSVLSGSGSMTNTVLKQVTGGTIFSVSQNMSASVSSTRISSSQKFLCTTANSCSCTVTCASRSYTTTGTYAVAGTSSIGGSKSSFMRVQ